MKKGGMNVYKLVSCTNLNWLSEITPLVTGVKSYSMRIKTEEITLMVCTQRLDEITPLVTSVKSYSR